MPAPGAKVTSTSTSLSGPKSSRSTEPKRVNSVIPHFRQKAAISSSGTSTLGTAIGLPNPVLMGRKSTTTLVYPPGLGLQ